MQHAAVALMKVEPQWKKSYFAYSAMLQSSNDQNQLHHQNTVAFSVINKHPGRKISVGAARIRRDRRTGGIVTCSSS